MRKRFFVDMREHENKKLIIVNLWYENRRYYDSNINNNIDDDVADEYPVNRDGRRGIELIINNAEFAVPDLLPERRGSEHDVHNLQRVLASLGFEVFTHQNCPAQQMRSLLAKYAAAHDEKYTDADCFLFFVMSHGDIRRHSVQHTSGGSSSSYELKNTLVFGADGNLVDVVECAKQHFNASACPALRRKPKLFFINACRGSKETASAAASRTSGQKKLSKEGSSRAPLLTTIRSEHGNRELPVDIEPDVYDFYFSFSSVEGHLSFLDTERGTLFVSTLVHVVEQDAAREDGATLSKIMKKVCTKSEFSTF